MEDRDKYRGQRGCRVLEECWKLVFAVVSSADLLSCSTSGLWCPFALCEMYASSKMVYCVGGVLGMQLGSPNNNFQIHLPVTSQTQAHTHLVQLLLRTFAFLLAGLLIPAENHRGEAC